jgi:hypothetical protein
MATSLGTVELARRVAQILEETSRGLAAFGGTGSDIDAILSWLEREDLSPAEVMELLAQLRRTGHLSQFLNRVSHRDLRRYLREKQVPWPFILQNWEPSINDSGVFFAGFAVGAGESITDLLRLVVAIIGAPFSAELAAQRDKFWESVRFLLSAEFIALVGQFVESPVELARLGLSRYVAEVENRLWNLEFFEAGRLLGYTLATILSVAGALKSLPAILRNIHKIAREVVELSVAQVRQLGLTLKRLEDFITSPAQQLVTPEGFILAKAVDEVVVLDKAASPVGKIRVSSALEKLASGAEEVAETTARALRGFARFTAAARRWLAEHKLLGRARWLLSRPGLQNVDDIVDAINHFAGSQGFQRVVGLWLRGLRGSTVLHSNMRKGAEFVMRYSLARLADLPRWAVVFEIRVTRLFRRYTDVLIPGLRIEFKSIREISPSVIRQLSRDLIVNLGPDLQRLKNIRFVFDSRSLQASRSVLLNELRTAVRADRHLAGHPRLEEILAAIDDIVEIWP